jgi:hypothetical protein
MSKAVAAHYVPRGDLGFYAFCGSLVSRRCRDAQNSGSFVAAYPGPEQEPQETIVSRYQLRVVGADRLPRTLSEFDVARFFSLLPHDAMEIEERFRPDRRLGVAVQLVFLRASGRPLDRLAIVPKALLHHLAKELGVARACIASLRSIYKCRETLYDQVRASEQVS